MTKKHRCWGGGDYGYHLCPEGQHLYEKAVAEYRVLTQDRTKYRQLVKDYRDHCVACAKEGDDAN